MQDEKIANFNELHRRGITDEVITAFNLSFCSDLPFAFSAGMVIPVNHPDGSFAFNKYRRSYINNDVKQKYAYDKGSHTALFGADKLREEHTSVVVTEGEMDALVLWSRNIPAVSSTGGAMSFQEGFVEIVGNRKVYLCYDNDDAGAQGLVRTLEILPDAYVVFVPEVVGVKDISDFVGRGGDFHSLMQTARQYKTLAEVEEDRQKRASQWLPVRFHDAYIEARTPRRATHSSGVQYDGNDELLRAKAVDCTQLHDFGRTHKGLCLWHSDSEPSLHYYPANNTAYCFSCGKHADAVDIVMAKHGISFKEAVKFLNNNNA